MNTDTNKLTLISRGAFLGYVICFCLGLVVFWVCGLPMIKVGVVRDLEILLLVSFYCGFYGMGLGIATELCFPNKSFRENFLIYFIAIFFSPPLVSIPILYIFSFIGTLNGYAFFALLTLISLGSIIACLCYKKASYEEFFTYVLGYVSVFVALFLSLILCAVLYPSQINPKIIYLLTFAIMSFIFATLSVLLTKRFLQNITKSRGLL